MKKLRYFLTLSLLLAFAACSDSSEELLPQEETTKTRVEVRENDAEFYMDGYDRKAIFMDNLAYIIYHEADKDAIVAALEKKKGSALTKKDTLFFNDTYTIQLRDYETTTESINQFLDCKRAAVKMYYTDLIDIPEVIDAEPYILFTYPDQSGPDSYIAVCNQIRISSGFGEKLEQTAKDANAIILGKITLYKGMVYWVVARTKDTVGKNVFETMKFFEEAGHRTEPTIHAGWPDWPAEIHMFHDF